MGRRGRTAQSAWHWMMRRAASEPDIGYLKQEHQMDRNRLKGIAGDRINAILSAAGINFRKLQRFLAGIYTFFTSGPYRQLGSEKIVLLEIAAFSEPTRLYKHKRPNIENVAHIMLLRYINNAGNNSSSNLNIENLL